MIKVTVGNGAAKIHTWRELGEWGAREMALATPNPGTKPLDPFMPGRRPGSMLPWPDALSRTDTPVSPPTPYAGGR